MLSNRLTFACQLIIRGVKMTDLNKLNDYEKGEWDCIHARPARECESAQYYAGYGDAYASEQSATWYSEKQFLEIMGEANE